MSTNRRAEECPWLTLAESQQGVISRSQLLGFGLTSAQARRDVVNQRWTSLLPGVYATFTGPVGDLSKVWSAVLYAGPGAVASHRTALWLAGLFDQPGYPMHVSVPETRHIRHQPGVRIHRTRSLDRPGHSLIHPAAQPPRIRFEEALLDEIQLADMAATLDLTLRSIQRRLTTAERLRRSLSQRSRQRWRRLLREVLADAADGVASPLERRYLHSVERSHGLPRGSRNKAETAPGGGHWYRDVRYTKWDVVIELDGQEAHPTAQAFRDMRRDNHAVLAGERVLRYGWRDVVGDPCGVARQVNGLLAAHGWTGSTTTCGTACKLA